MRTNPTYSRLALCVLALVFAFVGAALSHSLMPEGFPPEIMPKAQAANVTGVWDVPGRHVVYTTIPTCNAQDAFNFPIFEARLGGAVIKRVALIPTQPWTGGATNMFTYDVYNAGSSGSGTTSILTVPFSSSSGQDGTAGAARTLTITSTVATATLAQNSVLTLKRGYSGAGLAHSSMLVAVEFEPQ